MSINNNMVTSVAGKDGDVTLVKGDVNLTNVDNTSDANKPISTAQQTALNDKANLSGGNVFTGTQNLSAGTVVFDAGGETRFGIGGYTDPDVGTQYNIKYGGTSRSMAVRGISYFLDQMGIGAQTPVSSAKLQIDSTTQGFLIPRMTSAQRISIGSPAEGLMVFDTDLNTICEYSGLTWKFEYRINTTAIQTSTSATHANITEFTSIGLEAGFYVLELKGIMQSTSTVVGVGLRLAQGTATISTIVLNWGFSQAGAGTDKMFEYSQLAVGDNVTSASVATANTNFPVQGNGVFRISAAGTVAIQLRTETGGTGVSIRPDSTVMFKKIG